MAHESLTIREIVASAVNHSWSIPEFQRGFVWKSTQVRDLAESLWLDYPIGSLLVWSSQKQAEERVVTDSQRPTAWVVDGQQRVTALSILFGRKPYWWPSAEEWEKTVRKYDIRFDVDAKEPPYFWVANAAIRKVKGDRYVPLCKLLVLDTQKEEHINALRELSKRIKEQDLCHGMDVMEVYTRLDRVRKIRDKDIVKITIDQELEDVVEIFSRLNSKGTRVTEADIYLGIVAARTPGWVRSTFLPYLKKLADSGFDFSPNLLFRTVTAVGCKKVRFQEIPDTFWNDTEIQPAWKRTTAAWEDVIKSLQQYGILCNDLMPTEAALVTLVALVEKFPREPFEPALYWFLQASRFSRYSGSGTTSLNEDLKDIQEAHSANDAIRALLGRFNGSKDIEPDDFFRDYADSRFGRFILYLLIYRNKAADWDEKGHQLGFDGVEVLAGFRPQWHHVFPRKFLENKAPEEKIDALANIAVIGPQINIRISAKDPMRYIEQYKITRAKLEQQFVDPSFMSMTVERYDSWLTERAGKLAAAANAFLTELKKGI